MKEYFYAIKVHMQQKLLHKFEIMIYDFETILFTTATS